MTRATDHMPYDGIPFSIEHPDLHALVSTVRRVPSARARGAFDALVPDNWDMDEWRGGSCAAVYTWLDVDGDLWQVLIVPDGGPSLPRPDDPGLTWHVVATRYDEDENGEWILGTELMLGSPGDLKPRRIDYDLRLPPYAEGEDFPTGRVLTWVHDMVTAGNVILV